MSNAESSTKGRPWSFADYVLIWCCVLGALCVLPPIVPHCWWRFAPPNHNHGMRFPVGRMGSLLSVGDKRGGMMMWGKLRTATCEKSRLFNSPDPVTAAASFVVMAYPKAASLGGCATWPDCKKHMMKRCGQYWKLQYGGLAMAVLLVLSMLSACAAGVSMNLEKLKSIENLQKKNLSAREKLFENEIYAKRWTFAFSFFATCSCFAATGGWILLSTSALNNIRNQSFYPYMFLTGPGAPIALLGGMFLALGSWCAFWRITPPIIPEAEVALDPSYTMPMESFEPAQHVAPF